MQNITFTERPGSSEAVFHTCALQIPSEERSKSGPVLHGHGRTKSEAEDRSDQNRDARSQSNLRLGFGRHFPCFSRYPQKILTGICTKAPAELFEFVHHCVCFRILQHEVSAAQNVPTAIYLNTEASFAGYTARTPDPFFVDNSSTPVLAFSIYSLVDFFDESRPSKRALVIYCTNTIIPKEVVPVDGCSLRTYTNMPIAVTAFPRDKKMKRGNTITYLTTTGRRSSSKLRVTKFSCLVLPFSNSFGLR